MRNVLIIMSLECFHNGRRGSKWSEGSYIFVKKGSNAISQGDIHHPAPVESAAGKTSDPLCCFRLYGGSCTGQNQLFFRTYCHLRLRSFHARVTARELLSDCDSLMTDTFGE